MKKSWGDQKYFSLFKGLSNFGDHYVLGDLLLWPFSIVEEIQRSSKWDKPIAGKENNFFTNGQSN